MPLNICGAAGSRRIPLCRCLLHSGNSLDEVEELHKEEGFYQHGKEIMQALKFGMVAPTICGMKHPEHLDLEAFR